MRIWSALLLCLAGLLGAGGVGLAALASHQSAGPNLMTAALFLLIHAAAVAGLTSSAPAHRGVLAAASLLVLGVFLFSGDLALRGLAGSTPWHMAAPTGGMTMILGWLCLAATGLSKLRE